MLALLIALSAHAGTVVAGAAGGMDFGTNQPWAGLDLAHHADGAQDLLVPIGRITPGFGFADQRPVAIAQLGLLVRVPDDDRTVRVGLAARTWVLKVPYRLPIAITEKRDERFGLIPGVVAMLEFEFGEDKPFVFGVEGGVGSAASAYLCGGSTDQSDCITWFSGFIGGFYARGRLTPRLYLEALAGPTARVGVGYAFGRRQDEP